MPGRGRLMAALLVAACGVVGPPPAGAGTQAGAEPGAARAHPARDSLGYDEQLYLSWGAPYGRPGAGDRLNAACDDTSRIDTLYLSFRPGTDIVTPVAMECVLYFHPAPGDTLGEFWHFKRGWPNEGNLTVDLDYEQGFPCRLPWQKKGYGRVSYDHRSGRGRLDLSLRLDPEYGTLVQQSELRCVARVMFRHRRADLQGCRQPVCIEWASLKIQSVMDYGVEVTRGPRRLMPWNDPDDVACGACRATPAVRPWRPPVKVGETPATIEFPSPRDSIRVDPRR